MEVHSKTLKRMLMVKEVASILNIHFGTRTFKNVVAQFIGQPCLINQATTKIWG